LLPAVTYKRMTLSGAAVPYRTDTESDFTSQSPLCSANDEDRRLAQALDQQLVLVADHVSVEEQVVGEEADESYLQGSDSSLPSSSLRDNDNGGAPTVGNVDPTWPKLPLIVCDLGYGIPNEARPRKEKILAIARQVVNFLTWQLTETRGSSGYDYGRQRRPATIIVGCPDISIQSALLDRMQILWTQEQSREPFPSHLGFSNRPITGQAAFSTSGPRPPSVLYLSPDSEHVLDAIQDPPDIIIVGLLIDRRVQLDRSKNRAAALSLPTARWPLEDVVVDMDHREPLNCDCILEGTQAWFWNVEHAHKQQQATSCPTKLDKHLLHDAIFQAIRRHVARHPERPRHKPQNS
jgi:hypothetical protein